MLSSTSGSAGDEVTAIGRGFVKIKAYAALWIDSNDNGLIDDGEHVIDWGNIETPRGEFTHTFTIDSNFQGTSSVNVQDGAGMSVNTAMNPTFTVSGTYATIVPPTATVPIGRSPTAGRRDSKPAKSLQIAHFGVRVHCGRRRGAWLWRSCCPARL